MILTAPSLPPIGTLSQTENQSPTTFRRTPTLLKAGLFFVLLSSNILSEVGYTVGGYFTPLSLIALYTLIGILFATSLARIGRGSMMLYGACVAFCSISYVVNKDVSSLGSLVLLLVLHVPYFITITDKIDVKTVWTWTFRIYTNFMIFIAVAGIIQFFAQAVIHSAWLFDYKSLLPATFREPGVNTVIKFGSFTKSNGFFLAEPSSFSALAGTGIILEWALFRRYWRVAIYVLALMVSYSGSGIFLLIIFSLFPLGGKTLLRAAALAVGGATVLFLFGDALHLWQTVDRVNEFNSQGSSAYARFIAPARLLYDLFASEPLSPLFGHGPGMITRVVLSYDFHDPAYAKLLFEYGIFGAVVVIALVALGCRHSPAPDSVKAIFFVPWLIVGGGLLSPSAVSMMFACLAMWPSVAKLTKQTKVPLIRVPQGAP